MNLIKNCYAISIVLLCSTAFATLKPYPGEPPNPLTTLSQEDRARLMRGEDVSSTIAADGGGRAVRMFRVDASVAKIVSVIQDFDKYPEYTSGKVKQIKDYKPRSGDLIFSKFTLALPMVGEYNYHIIHNYPKMTPAGWWGTWHLDDSANLENDLDGSVGFWRVVAVPNSPNQSYVTYSIDLEISGWFVNLVRNMLINQGLDEATRWVREYATRNTNPSPN